jgi:CRP-like cAMP-binding protein
MSRMVRRTRSLAIQHVISALPSVEQRLLMLLTQLAGRWGRVRPGGIWIGLRLSHEILGGLIGARRPSVTTALGSLERAGAIRRERDGIWLLEVGGLLVEDGAGALAV